MVFDNKQNQYDTSAQTLSAQKRVYSGRVNLIFLGLIIVSVLCLLLTRPGLWQTQALHWQGETGENITGSLYLPAKEQSALPGILLLHGVTQDHQSMGLMAQYLAMHGFAVLSVDLPEDHYVQQQTALSAIHFLRTQTQVNAAKIAIVGHSMGASLAGLVAQQAGQIPVSVGIGMHPEEIGGEQIWITGIYDSLHPPWSLPDPSLVKVSASANHHTEMLDPGVHHMVFKILEQQLLLSKPETESGGINFQALKTGQLYLRFWAKTLLAIGFCGFLACQWPFNAGSIRGLTALSIAIAGFLLAGYFHYLPTRPTAIAVVLLLVAYFASQVFHHFGAAKLRHIGLVVCFLWVAREMASLLRGARVWIQHPQFLLDWPLALWQSLLYYPQALSEKLVVLLFQDTLFKLEPSWILLAILMLEWLFPCWYLKLFWSYGAEKQLHRSSPKLGAKKNGAFFILFIAILLLAGVLFVRLQQGYLRPETLTRLRPVLMGDILPTGIIFALSMGFYLNKRQKNAPEMT